MIQADRNQFLSMLKPGDVGLILADNFFSTMQNWRRIKGKTAHRASHAFMMRNSPEICEANGFHISNSKIGKFVGDSTKCWVFRNENATLADVDDMLDYMDGAVENGGHYSVGGILQFALQFIGIRKKLVDENGSFCSEFAIRTVRKAKIKIIEQYKPFEVDPSMLLSWLKSNEAKELGWNLIANYDGKKYFISEEELHV